MNPIEMIAELITEPVTIPVSLQGAIRLIPKEKLSAVQDLQVVTIDGRLHISGSYKFLMTVPFQVVLEPFKTVGRVIQLRFVSIEPSLAEGVVKKLLNELAMVKVMDNLISVDLNQLEAIRAVRVGQIRGIRFEEGQLLLTVSI